MNRLGWIDNAKGLGIVLVVWGHVWRGAFDAHLLRNAELFRVVDSAVYLFHMPLFFFLAGLFCERSLERHGFARFLQDKLATVAYPFVIWSLIQGVVLCLLSRYTNHPLEWTRLSTVLVVPFGQFWFLYALFVIDFAAGIAWSVAGRRFLWWLMAAAVVLLASPRTPSPPELVGQIVWNSLYFGIGGMTAQLRPPDVWNLPPWFAPASWIGLAALESLYLSAGFTDLDGPLALRALIALMGIAAMIGIAQALAHARWSFFQVLGRKTLVIYVLHILCASGMRIVLEKFLHVRNLEWHLLAGMFAGLGIPLAIEHFAHLLHADFLFSAPRVPIPNWRRTPAPEAAPLISRDAG